MRCAVGVPLGCVVTGLTLPSASMLSMRGGSERQPGTHTSLVQIVLVPPHAPGSHCASAEHNLAQPVSTQICPAGHAALVSHGPPTAASSQPTSDHDATNHTTL